MIGKVSIRIDVWVDLRSMTQFFNKRDFHMAFSDPLGIRIIDRLL